MGAHGVHRSRGPPRVRLLREDRPRLRQRIDPALLVLRRSERRAIVEIGATIPVAIPGELQHAGEPPRLAAVMLRTFGVASLIADRRELFEHDDEEPTEPDALAAPQVADAVHSVVPIARADERQSMRAVLQRAIDGANRMVEDRCGGLRALTASYTTSLWSGSSGGASRNGTTSSSSDRSPVRAT